ncbi:hypothetical protein [Paenibacillus montanisoli]|uniref:Uncharacterized protein n=1 Tax=Paenibacillus montanisoli TaxID=2081970 RepID=A0A328U271_9BACL|nr:hypothetical protein [Paenibacillus montanisoli]RAP76152.1 hypothetical protein DL346_12105 [Paenibacillus montanisoli]
MHTWDDYLALGIVGMARGGKLSWFNGHFGAALLAGYYMLKENELSTHVQAGIERTCNAYIERYSEWFAPIESEQAIPELLARFIAGLKANTEKLRSSGHGLALGVLALKALNDRPDLVTPSVIEGLSQMLERTLQDRPNRYWEIDDYLGLTEEDAHDIPVYSSAADMVDQSFAELASVFPDQVIDGQTYFLAGEQEHGITHAHALLELERLGYGELTKAGMRNHRLQMQLNRAVPDLAKPNEVMSPKFTGILSEDYWSNTYKDPHAIKVPYASLALLKRLPQHERETAEYNVCKLLTLMG